MIVNAALAFTHCGGDRVYLSIWRGNMGAGVWLAKFYKVGNYHLCMRCKLLAIAIAMKARIIGAAFLADII